LKKSIKTFDEIGGRNETYNLGKISVLEEAAIAVINDKFLQRAWSLYHETFFGRHLV
jgi:hypothetical protein